MSKLMNVIITVPLSLILSLCASGQTMRPKSPTTRDAITISPDRRYLVRFSGARSDGEGSGKLWETIIIRDRRTGRERTARIAEGQRGKGIFEGFCLYDDSPAWSPDGLYLAYWDDSCADEPAVPGGVVCFLHEIHFLSIREVPACREELVLGRYGFAGWAKGRAHTVMELLINEEGQTASRKPCVRRR